MSALSEHRPQSAFGAVRQAVASVAAEIVRSVRPDEKNAWLTARGAQARPPRRHAMPAPLIAAAAFAVARSLRRLDRLEHPDGLVACRRGDRHGAACDGAAPRARSPTTRSPRSAPAASWQVELHRHSSRRLVLHGRCGLWAPECADEPHADRDCFCAASLAGIDHAGAAAYPRRRFRRHRLPRRVPRSGRSRFRASLSITRSPGLPSPSSP